MKRGQVSVELLIIIALSFTALLTAGYFFYSYSQKSNDAVIRTQVSQIGNAFISNVDSTYSLMDGSFVTVDLKYPKAIRDIYILDGNPTELVIKYELSSGVNEAVFYSKTKISGVYNYPAGVCVE